MPIMTHCFDDFPNHMEPDLIAIYAVETFFQEPSQGCTLKKIKQKMMRDGTRLYAVHFGGRWLASAVVTGNTQSRQIHHLCVHASVRLRGIGKRLLNEIRRLESLAGNERLITLVSPSDQVAQSFLTAVEADQNSNKESSLICSELIPVKNSHPTSLCFNIMG